MDFGMPIGHRRCRGGSYNITGHGSLTPQNASLHTAA
jgi:hypothetical protein